MRECCPWRPSVPYLIALALFFALPASAQQEGWRGTDRIGKARLSMSLSEIEQEFPSVRTTQTPTTQKLGSDLTSTVIEVPDQQIPPFGKCHLRLQLLNDKLYQVQARCDAATEKLERELVALYGPAHFKREEPVIWYWRNTQCTLTYSQKDRQISLADNSWAPALFSRALRGAATAAPAPQPTP